MYFLYKGGTGGKCFENRLTNKTKICAEIFLIGIFLQ